VQIYVFLLAILFRLT